MTVSIGTGAESSRRIASIQIGSAWIDRALIVILIAAALLRLMALIVIPVDRARADDTGFYLRIGQRLLTHQITEADQQPFPPLYALVLGGATLIAGESGGVLTVRLIQATAGVLIAAFAYRIAYRLAGQTYQRRAAIIAASGIAFNPIMIIDNSSLVSETLFLLFTVWGLSLIVKAPDHRLIRAAAVGSLFGLAVLTRAALVAFPVGIVIAVFFVLSYRRAFVFGVTLMLAYAAVIGSWTYYNARTFNRVVIGGYGINDLLLTATVGYNGSQAVDQTYAEATGGTVPTGEGRDAAAAKIVGDTIRANPLGYLSNRACSLTEALIQPHQTTFFPGVGLKESIGAWVQSDRSVAGLFTLISDPTFAPKLLLYAAHFSMLIITIIGTIATLGQWRAFLPLYGYVFYFLLLHFFLLAIPRYLYPITPIGWIIGGVGLARLLNRRVRGDG